MNEFRKAINDLPLIVRILLALPVIDGIVYGIYRICRGDTPNMILGIVWIFIGSTVGWIVDIVMIILGKPVFEITAEMTEELKKEFSDENSSDGDKKDENE